MDAIPASVIEGLRADLPQLELRVLHGLRTEIPVFARPLDGAYGRDVLQTTRTLLASFVDRVAEPARDRTADLERSREYGRREVRVGHPLDALLGGYRVASRLFWREVSDLTARLELDREVLTALGEIVFAFFDELSVAAVQGFAEEQARTVGERARRDERLLDLLLREPATDASTLLAAADAAGWSPPRRLAAAAVVGETLGPDLAGRLAPGTLAARRGELLCLLVPADPDPTPSVRAALGPRRAALGPAVEWTQVARSFRRAALAIESLDGPGGLLVTDDRLLDLLLSTDPELVDDLADRALAPLDAVRPATRERLLATLRAWLDHQGHQGATAFTLGLHQQTVRYRLAQLRELIGAAMDEPDGRLALDLALRRRTIMRRVSEAAG